MIYLKPITQDNINDFLGTSYDAMSFEQKQNMIDDSINKIHNGFYFEFLVVYENDVVIGFMNLYAHSGEIFKQHQIRITLSKTKNGYLVYPFLFLMIKNSFLHQSYRISLG